MVGSLAFLLLVLVAGCSGSKNDADKNTNATNPSTTADQPAEGEPLHMAARLP